MLDTQTTITVKDEMEKLAEAAARYGTRRGIQKMPPEEATRELGAFTAGWNACREALCNG